MPELRRIIITTVVALLVIVGLGSIAFATGSGSTVTKPRLERSLTTAFSNVYSQQAALLGHTGVTPASLHAQAMCDKGPDVAQRGPGASWNCLMSWTDPNMPMPSTGYGKFELNVHSNDCYTAGSPSSLVGYQTITDKHGRTVNNPAYEFDVCFDPHADNAPTGVSFPAAASVAVTTVTPDSTGHVGIDVACNVGASGCAGTLSSPLGNVPFHMTEQQTVTLKLPNSVPAGTTSIPVTLQLTKGTAPTAPTSVTVNQ